MDFIRHHCDDDSIVIEEETEEKRRRKTIEILIILYMLMKKATNVIQSTYYNISHSTHFDSSARIMQRSALTTSYAVSCHGTPCGSLC